jgi:hypothetical protein
MAFPGADNADRLEARPPLYDRVGTSQHAVSHAEWPNLMLRDLLPSGLRIQEILPLQKTRIYRYFAYALSQISSINHYSLYAFLGYINFAASCGSYGLLYSFS